MNKEKNNMGKGPGYDNFVMQDGVSEIGNPNVSMDRSAKPYDNAGVGANYDKFVINTPPDLGEGHYEETDMNDAAKGKQFGQVKYAKRGAEYSIYSDKTRMTDNDKEAYGIMCESPTMSNDDESQGGKY